MMRRVGMLWLSISLCCLVQYCVSDGFVHAHTDGTVFLERGHRGIVPCPLVKSHQIPSGDVVAMYWYYDTISGTSLLISYFLGSVAPQNGIPEGVYDIDHEFNLIIENVTASNEGTYYFQLKPRLKMIEEGKVEVRDKVSPSRPYPTVIGCSRDHDADMCEVRFRHDSVVHNLTCVMDQVKPAVELRWLRASPHGYTVLDAIKIIMPVIVPAHTGLTYITSASIQVPSGDDDAEYVCEAVGVAVGNRTHTRVRLTKTATDGTPATYVTIATRDMTATHENTGTTEADKVLTNDHDPIQTSVCVNVSLVMSSVSLVCSLVIISYMIYHFRGRDQERRFFANSWRDHQQLVKFVTRGRGLTFMEGVLQMVHLKKELNGHIRKKKLNGHIRASKMESNMWLKTTSSDC